MSPLLIPWVPISGLLAPAARCDLYVHTSEVEIESLACMEGFAAGLVPLIANARTSATRYFALDSRSLFEAGNPQDLAEKIDWWIEHEEERKRMEHLYAEEALKYSLDKSIDQMIQLFHDEMRKCGKETE